MSLLLLAVMLVLGISSTRLVLNEERMATQTQDRALAFQAAEAALREVEAWIEEERPIPSGPGCSDFALLNGSIRACPAPDLELQPRWLSAQFQEWANANPVPAAGGAIVPQYVAEYLGGNFRCGPQPSDPATCKRYRITARASGGADRAAVTVQSVYATE